MPRGSFDRTDDVYRASKKELLDDEGDRTKTDTGWRDEYSKARERTLVKELGKITP